MCSFILQSSFHPLKYFSIFSLLHAASSRTRFTILQLFVLLASVCKVHSETLIAKHYFSKLDCESLPLLLIINNGQNWPYTADFLNPDLPLPRGRERMADTTVTKEQRP
jgi:hypothetical protein